MENAHQSLYSQTKNWLLSDIANEVKSSTVVYTLVKTAKANGLDPYAYLIQFLTEIPYLNRNSG